nr:hypothetical protein 1 [Red mite virga-like virus 1]
MYPIILTHVLLATLSRAQPVYHHQFTNLYATHADFFFPIHVPATGRRLHNDSLLFRGHHIVYDRSVGHRCFLLIKGFSNPRPVCASQIGPECGPLTVHQLSHTWYGTSVSVCYALPACDCPPTEICTCGPIRREPYFSFNHTQFDSVIRIAAYPGSGYTNLSSEVYRALFLNIKHTPVSPAVRAEARRILQGTVLNNPGPYDPLVHLYDADFNISRDFRLVRGPSSYRLVTAHCLRRDIQLNQITDSTNAAVIDYNWDHVCIALPTDISHDCPTVAHFPDRPNHNLWLQLYYSLPRDKPIALSYASTSPPPGPYDIPFAPDSNITRYPVSHLLLVRSRSPQPGHICLSVQSHYLSDVSHGLWDITQRVLHSLEYVFAKLIDLVAPLVTEIATVAIHLVTRAAVDISSGVGLVPFVVLAALVASDCAESYARPVAIACVGIVAMPGLNTSYVYIIISTLIRLLQPTIRSWLAALRDVL